MSYVSDVSVRTLKRASRLGFTLFKLASIENDLLRKQGLQTDAVGYADFVTSYFDALKLALTYDRRFIPADLPRSLDKTHAEMLESVFSDLSAMMDFDAFQDAGIVLVEFMEAHMRGDDRGADKVLAVVEAGAAGNPAIQTAHQIMTSMVKERESSQHASALRRAISGI